MKKMISLCLSVAFFALSALPAIADETDMVTIRRSILVTGEFQRYMPFHFTAPSVSCGNLETFEMKKTDNLFGNPGSWEKKYVGEQVSQGWYRFKLTGADLATCSPVIDISATIPKWTLTGNYGGSFMEIEPGDVGLLTQGQDVAKNIFDLSTDDRQYSYELVAMSPGTERELASFMQDTHFFSDTGKGIVGAVIADNRGFLKKKVMFNLNPQPAKIRSVSVSHRVGWGRTHVTVNTVTIPAETAISAEDNIIIREGDIVVLIRKESF